ncbi:Transcription factor HES-2 [Echinococcus granulosus]|uniref:Transcription factor HES-2 n=1 Tax=Echinococcus granulosus TaxID=6210 RepID=W6U381_ECHGR|nr:Transcription factor HES-2 [Echinococcus granulosus]EUB55568.1 Transcription factor HES-2 [Echinococcus granulosus]
MIGRLRPRNGSEDASRLRKVMKPLMEKKRRERINLALETLKRFVAEPILKEVHIGAQKLEKADILDLTVKYVHSCAARNSTPLPPQTPWLSFLAGYSACEAALRHLLTATSTTLLQPYLLPPRQTAALLMALEARKVAAASAFLDTLEQRSAVTALPTPLSSSNPEDLSRQQQQQERSSVWRPW